MRGRLLQRFLAGIRRLDAGAIRAVDPDGAGPLVAGYDDDFREPNLEDPDEDGVGEVARREVDEIQIPCQVESDAFEALRLYAAGHSPRMSVDLTTHMRDLERLGLVGDDGEILIRAGDRLGAIYNRAGAVVQAVRNPPGLFVSEAAPAGFGLGGLVPTRNLVVITFADRRQAAGSVAS